MIRNSLCGSWQNVARGGILAACGALAACSDSNGTVDPPPVNASVTAVTLDVFGASTVTGSGGVKFVNPGRYAVIPQYAADSDFAVGTSRASVPSYPFAIGGLGTLTARVSPIAAQPTASLSVAEAFHLRLRQIERAEAPRAIAYQQQLKMRPPVSLQVQAAQAQPENRDFKVLSSLTGSTYTTVTARLLYTGTNVLLYVDNGAPTTNTFTDAEYAAFGRQFDTDLFPIDTAAFGTTSDIDANGKTYVLFTPIVNRLTLSTGSCGSYVAGFFNGADLSGSTNGNRAEIFYSSVPGEPAGGPSCTLLSTAVVRNSAPATFIHELQHMISYNQHVLVRSAGTEAIWLNEGLSHMAEELGGKLYESHWPCPNLPPCPASPGRASTAQIFPDSAQGFLPPNFGNAYDFFSARQDYSLTSPTGFGTIEERGVAWLFLRWLVDQKGESKLRQLVQTRNSGTANIEAAAGENFQTLFADYLTAVLLDDFPGATTGQIASRYQFTSRNLRAIYARLNSIASASYPTAYPLDVNDLSTASDLTPASVAATYQMKPGSLDLFQFTSTTAQAGMSLKPPTGTFRSALKAQVTVVRLPPI
ncbi:MAG: hypothetical protein H7099_05855 [Gemmatimonadaceae bacterium]|nr:hypothetical protein [Gemmatimonadaceae bacterium]